MEFSSPAQRDCYRRVARWMAELFAEQMHCDRERPVLAVRLGSALANLTVTPWGDDDATISVRAYVVTDLELEPELLYYLLRQNSRMRFGAFGLDAENAVFFEHTIVGSTCDPAELRATVQAVVATADRYDDAIVSRWGGQRALDRIGGAGE